MNNETKGALLTLSGGICWGLSGCMGQYLFTHEGMDSRWLVPIRLSLAGILLFLYSRRRFKKTVYAPWLNREDRRQLLVYGLLGISLCQFLYFSTIQYADASAATILQDLSPIMILIVECVRTKQKPSFLQLLSLALALIGVVLITGTGSSSIPPIALLTGVLCAGCVTVYNCAPRLLLRRYPVLLLQSWAFLMGGAVFAVVFRVWTIPYTPSFLGLLGIAFVVLVGNILAFPLYMTGVKRIGPEKGILYGFSEPVTAALISTFFMGAEFTWSSLFGFQCIFAMLVLITKK